MDPSLLREREAFKKKALSQPTVEKRKQPLSSTFSSSRAGGYDAEYSPESSSAAQKKQRTAADSTGVSQKKLDYKTATPSSSVRFAVLGKIVKYMRTRHLQGEDYGLTVDEVLDETKQDDVTPKIRAWLTSEALPNNAKIKGENGKYIYKPSFDIKDKNGLLRLLEEQHVKGNGGILMDDIEESLAHAQKILEEVESKVVVIKRPNDKRQVVFLKDRTVALDMPEDIIKLWRSVSVEGMDAKKIADYLDKHGFSFMKNDEKMPMAKKRGRKGAKTGKFVPKHNEHVADMLQDYSAKLAK